MGLFKAYASCSPCMESECARGTSCYTEIEVAKFLIGYGPGLKSQTKLGLSLLRAASKRGHFDIVPLLLDNGADVDASEEGDWTPLHFASYHVNFEYGK
jgi:ankyrin repeat protein